MPKVFINYSHKDETWKQRLDTHLQVLEREGLLDSWNDRDIMPGAEWFPAIENAIEAAHVVVLLISANSLISDFILDEEVPRFLEKKEKGQLKIFPLIIKPCLWDEVKWLSKYQVRPTDGVPLSIMDDAQAELALVGFAREILKALRAVPDTKEEDALSYFPPEKLDLSRLPVTGNDLFGREKELQFLDDAWNNPRAKVISFIAWGGVGKSALVNAWLNRMDEQNFKGAERVYGWSFYSQGTREDTQASADGFMNDALKWFGHEGDVPKSQFEKGRLLASHIAGKRTLLVLDGLEPLQYPPGEMYGNLKDQAMVALLRQLARTMDGLCIVTSRAPVENLKNTEGRMSFTHELENLNDEAGKQVLKSYDLNGPDEEFEKTSQEFKGHALALNLVGSYLKTVHDGDIRKRDLIPKITEDEKHGGHARRVMESYEQWFLKDDKPELDILYLLGLFDRPASKEAIDVLKAEPAIPGLTDRLAGLSFAKWKISMQHLRDLSLIAKKENYGDGSLDCHPLIREHFGEKLQRENSGAWKKAHSRLYEYYKNLPEKELPDTLEEMEPLFVAIRHGCLAGESQAAYNNVFYKRIKRKNEYYILYKLGAYGSFLSSLSNFFKIPWQQISPEINEGSKAVILSQVGVALRAVGRLLEAVQPSETGLVRYIKIDQWEFSAIASNNLGRLLLRRGEVRAAQEYTRKSVDFADRSGVEFQIASKRAYLADVLFQEGRFKEAESFFVESEKKWKKSRPGYPCLNSLWGFFYHEMLIDLGRFDEVLERSQKILDWRLPTYIIATSLEDLSYGKVLMLLSVQNGSMDFSKAEDFLVQAVDGLRKAGEQDALPHGLLTRATLRRHQENFPAAWVDLDETLEIAEYGGMRLHLTDYYLEACRVIRDQVSGERSQVSGGRSQVSGVRGQGGERFEILEQGETFVLTKEEMQEKFNTFLAEAERLIKECGYHRRDGELAELKGMENAK
ncbi:MAG: TIR domain-containing protein [Bacteroidota bacterium]